MASKALPSPEVLRQLLRYDPETGKLFWRWRDDVPKSWNTKWAGKEALTADDGEGYSAGKIFKHRFRAHRVIWAIVYGHWPEQSVDHINGLRSDNRIENLRKATLSENQWNKSASKRNTSGFKGVTWHSVTGKWQARVSKHGDTKYLGLFTNVDDAAAAYSAAASKMHGEFFQP